MTHCGAYDVESVGRMTAPVADSLTTGIAQCHVTSTHRMHLGTQHFHTLHVGMLALYIGGTHEHLTLHVHQGTDGCRGHAMLSGTCLSDNTRLSHLLGQQDLADGVVDLVGTRVVQVLTFQIQLTAVLLTHALGEIKW